jgi:hypothetical protein
LLRPYSLPVLPFDPLSVSDKRAGRGNVPVTRRLSSTLRARERDRTADLILTKDVLYRLSYASESRYWRKRATGLEPATLSLEG